MLSMFKVSAKLVQLFLSIGLEESRFFRWHLDTRALYWKPAVPHHKGNFRRWKHPAKSQPGVASSVLALLFHPGLWFTVGQNKDPKPLQRDMDTSGMFRPPMGLTWLSDDLKSSSFLALNICGYETHAATSKCPFPICCHQLWEKKKKLQKSFNGAFESCQGFPSQHIPDPQGSTLVRCLHFL